MYDSVGGRRFRSKYLKNSCPCFERICNCFTLEMYLLNLREFWWPPWLHPCLQLKVWKILLLIKSIWRDRRDSFIKKPVSGVPKKNYPLNNVDFRCTDLQDLYNSFDSLISASLSCQKPTSRSLDLSIGVSSYVMDMPCCQGNQQRFKDITIFVYATKPSW